MKIIKAEFTDFDVYNDTIEGWNLEYNVLSKRDFKATLNMFFDDTFSLSRITLHGKLVHSGHSPIGYRTVIIPIRKQEQFIWNNKAVTGNDMLIFHKNCTLEAVTFNNFDAYVISIENKVLQEKINLLGYKNCKAVFTDNEKIVLLEDSFLQVFSDLSDYFLNQHISNSSLNNINVLEHDKLINIIIEEFLYYIENTNLKKEKRIVNKRSTAVKNAINLIHNNSEELYTVKELCILTNVSERTLLYSFKERFNVTPSEYIKAYRLNKVKNEIFALRNQNINISTIAGKYNFWHMGQFAQDFQKQFGILPSEILERK